MENRIAGILLAAGKSSRFGSPKLLQTLPDSRVPVVVQAAQNLHNVLTECFAVVRPEDSEIKTLLSPMGIELIENQDADLGLSSSIHCAIQRISESDAYTGFVIALADMPYIPPAIINQIAREISEGALLCAPKYHHKRGHPVGFSHSMTTELMKLSGDTGAKSLLEKYRHHLHIIDVSTDSVIRDINYPTDLLHNYEN